MLESSKHANIKYKAGILRRFYSQKYLLMSQNKAMHTCIKINYEKQLNPCLINLTKTFSSVFHKNLSYFSQTNNFVEMSTM